MPRIAASTISRSSILSTYSRRTRSMTSATSAADSIVGSTAAAAGAALARPMKVFQTVLESANPKPRAVPVSSTTTPRRFRAIRCSNLRPKRRLHLITGFRAARNAFRYVMNSPSRGCGPLRHPGVRINGLPVHANLEVQAGPRLPARITDLRNRLARIDPIAGFFEQRLVVAVEAHVAAAVVDDHEQAQALKPVRERNAATMDR